MQNCCSIFPMTWTLTNLLEGQAVKITGGVVLQIITAGAGGEVRHWTINGEKLSTVPSTLGHVFSLAYNTKNKKNEVSKISRQRMMAYRPLVPVSHSLLFLLSCRY